MGWITKNLTTQTPGTPLAVHQPTAWLFAQYTRHVVFQGSRSPAGTMGTCTRCTAVRATRGM